MNETLNEADFFEDLLKMIPEMKSDFSKLIGIAKMLCCTTAKHMESFVNTFKLVKIHFIIHQETLCGKFFFNNVMDIVVKAANLILSRALKNLQFKQFLLETEPKYGDLVYFCDVR